MGRKAKYPFLELQPGQTVVVRTADSAQAIAAAAWRASRQASDLLGEHVRFSVRRRDPEHYYLTRPLPGDDMTAKVIEGGAELPTLRVLTDEELQAQRDAAYEEKVRRQLREKFIRQKIEAEMEAELEEQKFELEKARRLRKARAEEELAAELAKFRAAAKQKAEEVEREFEKRKAELSEAKWLEREREEEKLLDADGLPPVIEDLDAYLRS